MKFVGEKNDFLEWIGCDLVFEEVDFEWLSDLLVYVGCVLE